MPHKFHTSFRVLRHVLSDWNAGEPGPQHLLDLEDCAFLHKDVEFKWVDVDCANPTILPVYEIKSVD